MLAQKKETRDDMKNLARKTSCHKECERKIAIAIARHQNCNGCHTIPYHTANNDNKLQQK